MRERLIIEQASLGHLARVVELGTGLTVVGVVVEGGIAPVRMGLLSGLLRLALVAGSKDGPAPDLCPHETASAFYAVMSPR